MTIPPTINIPNIPGIPTINIPVINSIPTPNAIKTPATSNFDPSKIQPPVVNIPKPSIIPPIVQLPQVPSAENTYAATSTRSKRHSLLSSSTTIQASLANTDEQSYVTTHHLVAPVIVKSDNVTETAEFASINDLNLDITHESSTKYDNTSYFGGNLSETIEKARNNSTIYIPEGEYHESIVISKDLHLIAQGKVILYSNSKTDTITINGGHAIFTGFTIIQETSQAAGAVQLISGSALFEDCKFDSKYMPTIASKGESFAQFKNCIIEGNDADIVVLHQNAQIVFIGSTIQRSKTSGVILRNNSRAKFENTNFKNLGRAAIVAADRSQFLVTGSTINNIQQNAISISSSGEKCIIKQTSISDCQGFGIVSYMVSTPVVQECKFQNCQNGEIFVSDGAALRSIKNSFTNSTKTAILSSKHSKIASESDNFENSKIGISSVENSSVFIVGSTFKQLETAFILTGEGVTSKISGIKIESFQTGVNILDKAKINMMSSDINSSIAVSSAKEVEFQNCDFHASNIEFDQVEAVRLEDNRLISSTINSIKSKLEIKTSIFDSSSIYSSNSSLLVSDSCMSNGSAGILVEDGKIEISNSKFQNIEGFAVSLTKNTTASVSSSLIEKSQIGFIVSDESKLNLQQTTIQGCINGIQANNKSHVDIKNSLMQNNKVGVVCQNNSIVESKNNKFEQNNTHYLVRDDSSVTLSNEILKSSLNHGIIQEKGKISLSNCLVSSSNMSGIASKGNLTVQKCRIEKCNSGIILFGQSSGEIKDSTIKANGEVGIKVVEGSVSIKNNNILEHSCYGIEINDPSTPTVFGNYLSKNRICNISRE